MARTLEAFKGLDSVSLPRRAIFFFGVSVYKRLGEALVPPVLHQGVSWVPVKRPADSLEPLVPYLTRQYYVGHFSHVAINTGDIWLATSLSEVVSKA